MNKLSDTKTTEGIDRKKRRTIMIVALLGMYMAVLDSVIISIALPTITSYFGADIAHSQWTMTGYLVAMTASMLIFTRLSASFGKNRMFLSGMAVFTISSLGCALAPTLPLLIGLRIVQGIGAAMSVSIVMAIIFELYSFSEHGKAMGALASTIAIASLSGPILGGFLLDAAGWPAIFLINIPIGIVLVSFGMYSMDLKKPAERVRMDWIGAGSLVTAVSSSMILMGLISEGSGDLLRVAACAGICLLSVAVFVRTERRHPAPLLDLSVFSERMFILPLLCMVLFFTALLVMYISLPFYLEGVMAFSPLQVGQVFMLIAGILTIGSPIVGRIFDRYQWKYYTAAGLFVAAVGLFSFALLAGTMDIALLTGALVIFTIGFTLFQSPINAEIMRGLPKEKSAIASGLNSAGRHFAMAFGASTASMIFALQLHGAGYTGVVTSAEPSLIVDATTLSMTTAAALCVAGIVLQILKKKAA